MCFIIKIQSVKMSTARESINEFVPIDDLFKPHERFYLPFTISMAYKREIDD